MGVHKFYGLEDLHEIWNLPEVYYPDDGGFLYNAVGEEISLEEFALGETVWDVPTIHPDEICRGMRALIVTYDGGDRGDNDYFRRITFTSCADDDGRYAYASKHGRVSLPDIGIDSSGILRHDVYAVEVTKENIKLLHEELKRTNYEYAAEQLRRLYPKLLR